MKTQSALFTLFLVILTLTACFSLYPSPTQTPWIVTATPGPILPQPPPPQPQPELGTTGEPQVVFTADRTNLNAGECATLQWSVQSQREPVVELNAERVNRSGQKQVCPEETTVFILHVDAEGIVKRPEIVLIIAPAGAATPSAAQITFAADRSNLNAGECATLQWSVQATLQVVEIVHLNGRPVERSGQQQVCPQETTTYTLEGISPQARIQRQVVIAVAGGSQAQPSTPPSQPSPTASFGQTPTQADLAATDLYPDSLPQGKVWVRITNNGPATVTNASVPLSCSNVGNPPSGGSTTTITKQGTLTVSLSPGQTSAFDTAVNVNTVQGYWYQVTCVISPSNDPNSSNNTYSEKIAQPAQLHVISADLAVTDLYPDKLPQGKVYARITNHGPDALTNAEITLQCSETRSPIAGGGVGSGSTPPMVTKITAKPGETVVFDAGITVNTSQFKHKVTCSVTFVLDPKPANNSYSENIPP